jgi:DNA-binding transcriptional LysR family regulator
MPIFGQIDTCTVWNVDIRSLRWFVAIADGATVAETAAASHTSQPAVTRTLHALATEFGVPLMERVGRRLRLTFAGEILASHARTILRAYEDAGREIAEANDPDGGAVRLGFLSPLGAWLIPQLLATFSREHPAARFELRHDGASRIQQAFFDGELDLLISTEPEHPGARWEPLFTEELMVVLPAEHRLAQRRRIRVAELADERWVLLPPGYSLRGRVEEICRAAGFDPIVGFEGHDLATLHGLIGVGSGVGLFPAKPRPGGNVRAVSLSPRATRTVGLATMPGRVSPRSADAFAQMAVDWFCSEQ